MEIFQHPIQICHQIILRLHSSSHTREKVSKCHKSKVSAPSHQNGLSTRTQRVGIFNFGTDRFRVLVKGSGIRYICKKNYQFPIGQLSPMI